MKNILVTGGAGFIGSNFLNLYVPEKKYHFINLDQLTYAGNLDNIQVSEYKNYSFIEGDICDIELLNNLFSTYKFEKVIHFAAESHVDNSITNPDAFIKTNITGTFNLLHQAYLLWMESPFKFRTGFENSRFLHVSTDEVYGTLEDDNSLFTEDTPYAPNSPYSASKASSDMIARSYFHTYGFPVITTNCSNNYGPHQHDEKLIPTIIRKAIQKQPIPIYGDGKNVRDWLYVDDHCKGIDIALHSGKLGETYNIGGKNERQNIYIANRICELLDELRPEQAPHKELINYVTDRPGHDFRYAIDATKIEIELGWKADETFETGILKTVKWYLEKYNQLQNS
ncbi:dTDP-glucose 4,6-dehydratase [Psychroflexus sp. CAK57W]|uniref:dTDP-glucose 4,6-dehydratase n=1 Tax=Psychroflexus curvus TaxID=2873595 RepID=UPI001CCAF43F|nr:dTDP-glucose 4,6-dehydratase [Psychroflexus curvus]MBZ9786863.1 dTDP-glucose 4,6-dehydratase [Psychroflexus curvus]